MGRTLELACKRQRPSESCEWKLELYGSRAWGEKRGELSEIEESGFNLVVAGSSVKLLSAGTWKQNSKVNSGI